MISDSAETFFGLLVIDFVMMSCEGSILVFDFKFERGKADVFDTNVELFDKPVGPRYIYIRLDFTFEIPCI
jgi:hypothetical protein